MADEALLLGDIFADEGSGWKGDGGERGYIE